MPSIDVVIPTFGRWDLTERCLAHLRQQTVTHSPIIVDNGSTDGTPGKVHVVFPEVRVIELGANLGFPIACNKGAAAGSGEIIVLLNNDVEARPDFLERLVSSFDDSRVGTATPLLVRPGEQTIDCVGLCADSTLAGFPRLRGRPTSEAESVRPVLAGPCGGGGAYRRTAWDKAAGLDEGVTFYGEDLDLALRITAAGWKAVAVPDAVAVHLGSATAEGRSSWQRYQGGFARGYFLRRYGTLATAACPRTLLTEGLVICGDVVISHDLSAIRGRVAGWRAARRSGRHATAPTAAVDRSIGLLESLRMRRAIYAE